MVLLRIHKNHAWIVLELYCLSFEKEYMDKYLGGTMEEFEQWIRFTIGSDFEWLVRPLDRQSNREMVTDMVCNDIERSNCISHA